MPEASQCQYCGASIYWTKSKRTGKAYCINDPEDRQSFHNCKGREETFGQNSDEKPADALRKTGWVIAPPKSKEKWLEEVLDKAVKAVDRKELDVFKIDIKVREAFKALLRDAEETEKTVAEQDKLDPPVDNIPF